MNRASFAAAAALSALPMVLACASSPNKDDRLIASGPDAVSSFAAPVGPVEAVFERRCGSLDCHGQIGRAMRIYGAGGFRLPNDAGLSPSSGATTGQEITANYKSIVGLEPEQMDKVIREKGDPYSLLILKKPLNIESHKGGPALVRGDEAETCISSWISGKTSPSITQKCITAAAPR